MVAIACLSAGSVSAENLREDKDRVGGIYVQKLRENLDVAGKNGDGRAEENLQLLNSLRIRLTLASE